MFCLPFHFHAAVVGADADGEPERPSVACSAFKVTRPTIVVFGSEGKGLRTNVRKARASVAASRLLFTNCDFLLARLACVFDVCVPTPGRSLRADRCAAMAS